MQRSWIEEVPDHPVPPPLPAADSGSGKVRALTLDEIPREQVSPMVGSLIVGSSGLDLRPSEIRAFVAQESEAGEVEGWVEAKRTVDQMEDTITVGLGGRMR